MFNSKTSIALATLLLAGAAHAAAFTDGSFSEAASMGNSYGAVGYDGAGNTIGPWTLDSGSVDLIKSYWQLTPNGSYSVDMNGLTAGSISQTFDLAAGTYVLSFYMAGNPDGSPASKSVDVSVGDQSLVPYTFVNSGQSEGNMGWTLETLKFTSTGATTLTFASTTGVGSSYSPFGAAIGGVTITSAVPEPASLGLLLAGIGMLGVMSSRRRAR